MWNWFKNPRNTIAPVPKSVVLKFTYGELVLTDPYGESFSVPPDGSERVFGRSSNSHFTVLHPKVSREHAIIRSRAGQFEIRDCSSNGTQINGRRISRIGWHPLSDGDEVTLGEVRLQAAFCDEK